MLTFLVCPVQVWGVPPELAHAVHSLQELAQWPPEQLPDSAGDNSSAFGPAADDFVRLPLAAAEAHTMLVNEWIGVTVHAAYFPPKHYGVRLTASQGLVSLICKVRRKELIERPSCKS